MTERLIAKLDRLGAEAGIKEMTPEIYRFSQLLNDDKLKQWEAYTEQLKTCVYCGQLVVKGKNT